jgi:hypothetical protein
VADCRDPKVIQTTAPLRELAAGLFVGFESRLTAERFQKEAGKVREAMSLLAVSQEGQKFNGAALNLVNEMARQLKCTRVSIGWVKGRQVKLVSMSDTENLKRHSEDVARLELAMAECLDQQHPIVFPVPDDAEPLLLHAVVHAHKRVTGEHPNRFVVSIPMRFGDEWIGVLTLERANDPFDGDLIQQLQLVADVVAPHLADRRVTSRWLPVHAWHSVTDTCAYLVGPRHVGWKMLGLAAFAGLMYVMLGYWDYKVSSDFSFDPVQKRVVPAPMAGRLERVFLEPGESLEAAEAGVQLDGKAVRTVIVKAGTPLGQLDVTEKTLELIAARARLAEAQGKKDQALAEAARGEAGKLTEAKQAEATIHQTQAQIGLLEYQIEQATLRAPIDGELIDGVRRDKMGTMVEIGDVMFEVAQVDDLLARIRVDEADIDLVRDAFDLAEREGRPLRGTLATRAIPELEFNFTVERILPLAQPSEGINVFEVQARFSRQPWSADTDYVSGDTILYQGVLYRAAGSSGPSHGGAVEPWGETGAPAWEVADWLRPGMEGIAKIEAGRRSIRWVLTHRVVDTVRLWTWLPW